MRTSLLSMLIVLWLGAAAQAYDPLARTATTVAPMDLTVRDANRARDIPIRVYLPAAGTRPLILFSPGLGGSRDGYSHAAGHWAARGYVVVVLQHPGSDDAVWKDAPIGQIMASLRTTETGDNFMLRVRDVAVVLDTMQQWNQTASHPLFRRIDMAHVGMAGHSFGAITTQAVSGESFGAAGSLTDDRIRAAIAMSPSPPRLGDPKAAFGQVRIPWMLMTGTQDSAPVANQEAATRLQVFPCLPPGDKYQVVLDGAQHSAFSDRPLPTEKSRDPRQTQSILALSTAFWDTYLSGNADARHWLQNDGPRTVLAPRDVWQTR